MMNSVVICNQLLKANGALFLFWGWGEAQREGEEGAKATKY